jgi:uncharacterized protein (DUF302 family)
MQTEIAPDSLPHIEYGITRSFDQPFAIMLERVQAALQQEGFGILFVIDLREKLREKLGVEYRSYSILGACNPALAYQALNTEIGVGLLLPCNIVVFEESSRTVVSAIDADRMMSFAGNSALSEIASQVSAKLHRVMENL